MESLQLQQDYIKRSNLSFDIFNRFINFSTMTFTDCLFGTSILKQIKLTFTYLDLINIAETDILNFSPEATLHHSTLARDLVVAV